MAYSTGLARPMARTPPLPSWSDIPLELAGLVLLRLPALADRAHFAAVCQQWWVATKEVPLPAPLPLLALPDGTMYSLPESKPFHFPGCVGYVDACGDWLAFSGEDGFFLKNPFSHATVTLPQQFRVRDHRHHAGVRDRRRHANDGTGIKWMVMEDDPNRLTMCKLLYCSPQLVAAFVGVQRNIRIAVCQPGAASWWTVYMGYSFPLSVDMAFHQGKIYVIQEPWEILFTIVIRVDPGTGDPWVYGVRYDIKKNPSVAITRATNEDVTMKMFYLVELDGALLIVCRKMPGRRRVRPTLPETDIATPTGGNEFKVFRGDPQQSKWIELTTIGKGGYARGPHRLHG
ncbi:hypothetical protein HU200_048784 [Digitaria exilis]|uniref:KIB1-4 beta-propeller domain-containing protein n=1 Tax=Digitaria exilis TaxID=1010633 RepID=A0A835AU70_9POAL|nr:hypothetical protein HU200_048784 [Digitaria exilis]